MQTNILYKKNKFLLKSVTDCRQLFCLSPWRLSPSKRKQTVTLHGNFSEKKALFTDIDYAGRENPGVFSRKHVLQIECVVLKLPWSLRNCVCSHGTKTPMLSSLFNIPPLCHSAGLGLQCNTWDLGDHLTCSPGPCVHFLDEAKSCTRSNQT